MHMLISFSVIHKLINMCTIHVGKFFFKKKTYQRIVEVGKFRVYASKFCVIYTKLISVCTVHIDKKKSYQHE